jgi:hypothetical protein
MKEIDLWPVSSVKRSLHALVTKYYDSYSEAINNVLRYANASGGNSDILYCLVNVENAELPLVDEAFPYYKLSSTTGNFS